MSSAKILAYNLRFKRAELGLTQDQVAQSAGLSHRAYQQLESGEGNPSLDSLVRLSRFFKVPASSFLRLERVRLPKIDVEKFNSILRSAFEEARLPVIVRDSDGRPIWATDFAERFLARRVVPRSDELFEQLPDAVKKVVRVQFACEKRGVIRPYSTLYCTEQGESVVVRCYPTVVYPNRGDALLQTIVFFVDAEAETDDNYYTFTETLMKALSTSGWVEKVI